MRYECLRFPPYLKWLRCNAYAIQLHKNALHTCCASNVKTLQKCMNISRWRCCVVMSPSAQPIDRDGNWMTKWWKWIHCTSRCFPLLAANESQQLVVSFELECYTRSSGSNSDIEWKNNTIQLRKYTSNAWPKFSLCSHLNELRSHVEQLAFSNPPTPNGWRCSDHVLQFAPQSKKALLVMRQFSISCAYWICKVQWALITYNVNNHDGSSTCLTKVSLDAMS